jgi:ornithine cyclodeaminase/alanine dehydrogenase-like protein (mu-crystallin family)
MQLLQAEYHSEVAIKLDKVTNIKLTDVSSSPAQTFQSTFTMRFPRYPSSAVPSDAGDASGR